jgi:hypothetical protein
MLDVCRYTSTTNRYSHTTQVKTIIELQIARNHYLLLSICFQDGKDGKDGKDRKDRKDGKDGKDGKDRKDRKDRKTK